jgi:hypothetical protein
MRLLGVAELGLGCMLITQRPDSSCVELHRLRDEYYCPIATCVSTILSQSLAQDTAQED